MSYTPRILKAIPSVPVVPVEDEQKNTTGTQNHILLPLVDDSDSPDSPDSPGINIIRDASTARAYSEELEEEDICARATCAIRGGMFFLPGQGHKTPDPAPLPLGNEPETRAPVPGHFEPLPGHLPGHLAKNSPDPAEFSSHIHKQIATFTTWAAAWAFGAGLFDRGRVGFHYDQAQDLYTVTLEAARPPASPLPDLPVDLRKTFTSYAEAHAYGRDLVGRYRISTWRDPITERYAVTDPGWVEERLAEVRRREMEIHA